MDDFTVDLKLLPKFTERQLDATLTGSYETDIIASNAYRNKVNGYKLWKEAYVKKVRVKPNITTSEHVVFIVKCKVSASMKRQTYDVCATCSNLVVMYCLQIVIVELERVGAASMLQLVCTKHRQHIFSNSILDQIQKTKVGRTVNAPSLQWGIDKEETALAKYQENMTKPLQVISCGLMINPKWPWLGASHDGLVIHSDENCLH